MTLLGVELAKLGNKLPELAKAAPKDAAGAARDPRRFTRTDVLYSTVQLAGALPAGWGGC